MPLKITLKPGERVVVGGAVITNEGNSAHLAVETNTPVLRQREILSAAEADTHCRNLYFLIQLMYLDEGNLAQYQQLFTKLMKELVEAAPSTLALVDTISTHLLGGEYYKALKAAKKLIEYERTLIERSRENAESRDHHADEGSSTAVEAGHP
jgi:flagellar protein FlbT